MENKNRGLYRHIRMSTEAASALVAVLAAALVIFILLATA